MIEVLSHDVRRMREDMQEMKGGFVKMTEALNKLILVEERQTNMQAAQDRSFDEIAKLQKRADDDANRHTERIETAIADVRASVQRLHTRIDDYAKETQNDIDGLSARIGTIEQSLPETNRLKEWAFEGIRWLAIAGLMTYAVKAGMIS